MRRLVNNFQQPVSVNDIYSNNNLFAKKDRTGKQERGLFYQAKCPPCLIVITVICAVHRKNPTELLYMVEPLFLNDRNKIYSSLETKPFYNFWCMSTQEQ